MMVTYASIYYDKEKLLMEEYISSVDELQFGKNLVQVSFEELHEQSI